MNPVELYARDVVAGRIPAGKYHVLSCKRHLNDLARQGTPAFPYVFRLDLAERNWRFAENLKHYKGEWAGQQIVLQPHQKFRRGCKFGWVHQHTGLRRFRNSYEEIPRKNGKSLDAATDTLYLTFFDGEAGAEGYVYATKRDQALIVFGDCKKLVTSSGLKSKLKVQVSNIHDDRTASKLEPLSSDHDSLDGLNIHMVTLDEMHAYKDRGGIDVVETATGARRQPLVNKITTAGDDPVSPCGDEHDYACKVLEGVIVDETYFAFIAHADPDDPWDSLETARKANPNYGVSVKPDDLAAKITKARNMPSAAASYKQKHLNLWVNASAPCLSIDGWRKGQSHWAEDDLLHEPCYVGVDLASKLDLMALSFVFPPSPGRSTWNVIQRIWTPADTLTERAHRDRAPYQVWADQGWLTTCPGSKLNNEIIRQAVLAARDRFHILQIGYDPWHVDTPIQNLVTLDGFAETEVVEVPQSYAGMSAGCLELQAEILAGRVNARGCPVTAWAVSNAVASQDGKGNLMFTKDPKKSKGRIDPVISMTIGVSLWKRKPVEPVMDWKVHSLSEYLT